LICAKPSTLACIWKGYGYWRKKAVRQAIGSLTPTSN